MRFRGKNKTVILLPQGTQIGPNNPIQIINPAETNNIKLATTNTSGLAATLSHNQMRSITLIDPSVLETNLSALASSVSNITIY